MNTKALCAALFGVAAVGGFAGFHRSGSASAAMPSPSSKQAAIAAVPAFRGAAVHPESVDLKSALERGIVAAEFKGNGRERMTATLTAKVNPLTVTIPAGQMLDNGLSSVIVMRSFDAELKAGKSANISLQTAATRSANKVQDAPFHVSFGKLPHLDALLAYVGEHPELSVGAVQTAVLALNENLPLNAVSKFSPASGNIRSHFDTTPFRVETLDILNALSALREIGVKDSALAMTIDPQLEVEAMIEPLTKALAMRYYGIAPENEWEYWKTQLLNGDPSTRHYALYGIARFYPDIALEMLPRWAKETKTTKVFRMSAIQALADTQKAEALPILRELMDELGPDTDLGRAAASAARYLDASLAKMGVSRTAVAFRDSKTLSQF